MSASTRTTTTMLTTTTPEPPTLSPALAAPLPVPKLGRHVEPGGSLQVAVTTRAARRGKCIHAWLFSCLDCQAVLVMPNAQADALMAPFYATSRGWVRLDGFDASVWVCGTCHIIRRARTTARRSMPLDLGTAGR